MEKYQLRQNKLHYFVGYLRNTDMKQNKKDQ